MCQCDEIINRSGKEDHNTSCPFVKVDCVCGKKIERGNMEVHNREECTEMVIACDYEKYGCLWRGKRLDYHRGHQNDCKVKKLHKRCISSERGGEGVLGFYKKSDCFLITGLVGGEENRRTTITSYLKSYMDLKFPISFGSLETQDLTITSFKTSGIFDIIPANISNCCMVDMDLSIGVMIITFYGKKDRLIIVPTKSTVRIVSPVTHRRYHR